MEDDMDFPNTDTDLPNAGSNLVAAGTRDLPTEAVVDTTPAPTPPEESQSSTTEQSTPPEPRHSTREQDYQIGMVHQFSTNIRTVCYLCLCVLDMFNFRREV